MLKYALGLILAIFLLTAEVLAAPPTGVVATGGDSQVTITWDAVPGAISYNIYWNMTGGVTMTDNKITDVTSPYPHIGLTNGVTYYYVVTTVDADGESAPSLEISAMPYRLIADVTFTDINLATCVNALGLTYVHQVTTLACNAFNINNLSGIEALTSLTSLELNRNNINNLTPLSSLINLTRLDVSRNVNIIDISPLEQLSNLNQLYLSRNSIADVSSLALLTNLNYLDLGNNSITTGVATLVTLTSATSINLFGNNNIPCEDLDTLIAALGVGVVITPITCDSHGLPPTAPGRLSAVAGDGQVTLSWTKVSGATSYNLYMTSEPGVTKDNYNLLADGMKLTGVVSPYVQAGLSNGTTYYFVVTAVNEFLESVSSNEVSATPGIPSAPTGVNASAGNGQITISWDSIGEATSYNIYMATQSGVTRDNYTTLVDGTKLTGVISPYVLTGLTNGMTYYLIVTAVNADGESEGSMEVSAIPAVLVGEMITPRYNHTATLLPDGKVLIAGGVGLINGVYNDLSSAELYDPTSGSFTATGSMNTARELHTATLLPNGKVLITGGINPGNTLSSAELYDPVTGSFTTISSMTAGRVDHTATLLSNRKVLITGGYPNLSSSELYDPDTNSFTTTGNMTTVRFWHTATMLSDGKVLVTGGVGFVNNVYVYHSSAEIYDPVIGTFTATGSMSTAHAYHKATLLPNGNVLVAGGEGESGILLSNSEVYDPDSGQFNSTESMVTRRANYTETLLPNGKVLIAGGYGGGSSAELYDPGTGVFTNTGSMAIARDAHTATLLNTGMVLMAGGLVFPGTVFSPSAELYDPETDTFTITVTGNPPPSTGPITLASGVSNIPYSIAVDSTSVYWIERSTSGAIKKVSINGGTVTTLASSGGYPASGISVDSTSVYWAEQSGTVKKVSLNGGTVTTLASGMSTIWGMTADSTSVYWTETGTIKKVSKDGGMVTTLAAGVGPAHTITVDSTSVYWTGNGGGMGLGTVKKMDISGGTVTTLVASGLNQPEGIAVDSTNVYWTEFGGAVSRVPINGGSVITLASGESPSSGIAVDSTNIYWKDDAPMAVKTVSIDGGTVTILATSSWYGPPAGIAIDSTYVYWTEPDAVKKVSKQFSLALSIDVVISPTNSTTQTITGTVEAGASVSVVTDTSASDGVAEVIGTAWSYTITGLVEGVNNVTVTATDAAGNKATATVSITLDTTFPETTIISGPAEATCITSASVTLSWSGSDNYDGALTYSYQMDGNGWSLFDPSTSITYDNLSEGPHTFSVKAKDSSGNIDATPAVLNFNVDMETPVLSNIASSPRDYNAAITWNTSEPATAQVEYGETSAYGMSSPLDATMTGAHIVIIDGLMPNTMYHHRVRSNDGCREVVSGDMTFTTTDILYPNLHVTQIDMLATVKSLEQVNFKWLVRNDGPGSAQGNWTDKVFLSGDEILDSQDTLLGEFNFSAGMVWETERWRSTTINMPTMPAGTYYIIVQTDANDGINESNENDNNLTKQIDYLKVKQMGAAPDQISVQLTPGEVKSGSIDLINFGDTSLTGITAEVQGGSPNINIQAPPPSSIPGKTVQKVSYSVTASDDSVDSNLPVLMFSSAEGEGAGVTFNITVNPGHPNLVSNPGYLEKTMVRGAQTFVEFEIMNNGSAAVSNLKIILPSTDWLSLVTPDNISSLGRGEKTRVSLALKPRVNLPLGPYTGNFSLSADNAGANVDFRFTAVSDKIGGLKIVAKDEFTYFAADHPPVSGAAVKISNPYDGTVIAGGVTDAGGQFVKNDLFEGLYRIEVSAEKHGTFNAIVQINPGQIREITAFLPRQLVTYSWKVVPVQTDDRYIVTLEAVFETQVPAPVITVEPTILDLSKLQYDADGRAMVNYTVTNHGLIAANGATIRFGSHPDYEMMAISENIGEVPAMTSMVIPVAVSNLSSTSASSSTDCGIPVVVDYYYVCDYDQWRMVTVYAITGTCPQAQTPYVPNPFESIGKRSGSPGDPGGGWWIVGPTPTGISGPSGILEYIKCVPDTCRDECCRKKHDDIKNTNHLNTELEGWGYTGCCNSKLIMCLWGYNRFSEITNNVLNSCIIKHENIHLDNNDSCPIDDTCTPKVAYLKWGLSRQDDECQAYTTEMRCLEDSKAQCNMEADITKTDECLRAIKCRMAKLRMNWANNPNLSSYACDFNGIQTENDAWFQGNCTEFK